MTDSIHTPGSTEADVNHWDHVAQDMRNERRIRPDIVEALDAWADGSCPFVGDFLRAVLSNDLTGAMGRADSGNLVRLPAIVGYVYRHLPSECHGSAERVNAWQKHHADRLRAEREKAGAR